MKQQRIESLTGLRAVAAIWVIWFHAMGSSSVWYLDNFLRRGYTGVDLFFVLSGFVISYVYADKMKVFSWKGYHAFIRKRFIRIYPSYLSVLLLTLAIILIVGYFLNSDYNTKNYSVSGFFMQLFMLSGLGIGNPHQWNYVSWTVSSEFAAYLCYPIFAVYFSRLNSKYSVLAIGLMFLLCFTMAFYINDGRYYFLEGPWTLSRIFSEFIMGILIYNIYKDEKYRKVAAKLLYPALMILIASSFIKNEIVTGFMVLSYCLIILSLASNSDSLISKCLSVRPLVYLGEISYSTYLVQALVLTFVSRISSKIPVLNRYFDDNFYSYPICNIVISCLAGAFFYRYVESFFYKKLNKRK